MSVKPLTSFLEGLRNKITNPFFGTLIGVWIVHNYRFVYSVFNFDPNTKLDDKLKLVDKYFKSDVFLENLWTCIWHALIVLVVTYLLLIISRAIVTLFDKRLSLWVYKYIYSKKIKSIEDFEEVVQLGEMAQKRYEEEQKSRLAIQTKHDDLEKRYQELLKGEGGDDTSLAELLKSPDDEQEKSEEVNLELEPEIEEALKKSGLSAYGIDQLKREVIAKTGSSQVAVPTDSNGGESKYNLSEAEKKQIRELRKNPILMEAFDRITVYILKKQKVDVNSTSMDEFLMLDLVTITEEFETDRIYDFTERGRYLRETLLNGDSSDLNYSMGA